MILFIRVLKREPSLKNYPKGLQERCPEKGCGVNVPRRVGGELLHKTVQPQSSYKLLSEFLQGLLQDPRHPKP